MSRKDVAPDKAVSNSSLPLKAIIKRDITTVVMWCLHLFTRMCFFLPVNKKRVIFCSYSGRQMACNPLYLYKYVIACFPNEYECIWTLRKKEDIQRMRKQGVKVVRFLSPSYFYAELTAGISINNAMCYLPARKGQIKVNTWHGGGCYKRIGEGERMNGKNLMHGSRYATHFLSGSRYSTEHVIRGEVGYQGNVLEYGLPRNDIFWKDNGEARSKVGRMYGLDAKAFWILYAPTWRYDGYLPRPDFGRLREEVSRRFGREAVVLYRFHYLEKGKGTEAVVDASGYPDMQELLCACDMLLSDYSSCIWDYSFTYRPCFLYVPDLRRYETERGFCEDIHTWGFPVCESEEELYGAIRDFRADDFQRKMEKHHEALGSFENGNASEAVWSAIECFQRGTKR